MPDQSAFTALFPVKDENVKPLQALLNAVGQNITKEREVLMDKVEGLLPSTLRQPGGRCFLEFHKLTTVHFLRWVLLEPALDAEGKRIDASLAFATDYDGPLNAHIDELIETAGPALEAIFSFCDPAPATGALRSYLLEAQRSYEAFYRGHPGRSVQQIWGDSNNSEEELRKALGKGLDGSPQPATSEDAVARLRRAVGQSGWKSASTAGEPQKPSLGSRSLWLSVGAILLLFAILAPSWFLRCAVASVVALILLILLVGSWGTILNLLDRRDQTRERRVLDRQGPPPDPDGSEDPYVSDRSRRRLMIVTDLENRRGLIQNQMTHVVNVKPGKMRLRTLRIVLWAINFLGSRIFVQGKLGDIPTIHFARWILIDDNRRLLFFSNYDFSWESYLGDFIDLASDGLTGIWCNTTFFPQTRIPAWMIIPRALRLVLSTQSRTGNQSATRLFEQGARREQEFKKWTRDHQVPTQVWYSAYPLLSVVNVNNSTDIARGLFAPHSGAELGAWLRKL
ncbi:MAG TPA: hypothetical protein PKD12_07950 [Nitrospira sp.]|nr:hypothetical protein [Nitrospira sp.]